MPFTNTSQEILFVRSIGICSVTINRLFRGRAYRIKINLKIYFYLRHLEGIHLYGNQRFSDKVIDYLEVARRNANWFFF